MGEDDRWSRRLRGRWIAGWRRKLSAAALDRIRLRDRGGFGLTRLDLLDDRLHPVDEREKGGGVHGRDGDGSVKLGTRRWRLRGPTVPAGTRVRVTGVDGTVLIVDRLPG